VEIGCGNGITAIEIARRFDVDLTATDFAEDMVKEALRLAEGQSLRGRVTFSKADVTRLEQMPEHFDLAYTERVLINLSDWEAQRQAILTITSMLRPGGRYLMCENSQDGLDRINELRASAGLAAITPPWHNRYLRDSEIGSLSIPGVTLEEIRYHSSTYYFLSRVVNAWLAAHEGKEPDYESSINRLALELPPIGTMGQGRVWVWRKE
jgi:ubiquinone/menaquinone biosynthesis C-methylase UbiE